MTKLKTDASLLQSCVSKSVLLPQDLSHIFKNINHKPCTTIGYDFALDISKNGRLLENCFIQMMIKNGDLLKIIFRIKENLTELIFRLKKKSFLLNFSKLLELN